MIFSSPRLNHPTPPRRRPDLISFRSSIVRHKQKIEQLGMQLLVDQSDNFWELSRLPHIALRYLKLHDNAKFRLPNLVFLHGIYGRSLTDMPLRERHAVMKRIQELNSEEECIKQRFLRGFHEARRALLKAELDILETVADCVARYLDANSVYEFGYTLQPASDYLKCPMHSNFARYLESRNREEGEIRNIRNRGQTTVNF